MKFLNLGCGGVRPKSSSWVNLDDLHSQLTEGSGARQELDSESNYINHIMTPDGELPFPTDTFDGILCSHVVEHFNAIDASKILYQCRAVMKEGGALIVSVPNASYFRSVYGEDRNENWPRLFGVNDPPNPIPTFFQAALWFEQHLGILTADSLWCYLIKSGFNPVNIHDGTSAPNRVAMDAMIPHLNRIEFSLIMSAIK